MGQTQTILKYTSISTDFHGGLVYQVVDVGGNKTVSSTTGLANDATTYTASIVIGPTTNAVTITGSRAQTLGSLITEINNQLGKNGYASIKSGNLIVSSGNSGGVVISDTNLFSTLTGYVSVIVPVGVPIPDVSTVLIVTNGSQTATLDITLDEQEDIFNGTAEWFTLNSIAINTTDLYQSEYGATGIRLTATGAGVKGWIKI